MNSDHDRLRVGPSCPDEALVLDLARRDRADDHTPSDDFPRPPCAGPSSGANENTGQGGPGR